MSLDFTDDQSTLLPVMAWCRQATSHYLSWCWPRSLSPYGVTGHNELTDHIVFHHWTIVKLLRTIFKLYIRQEDWRLVGTSGHGDKSSPSLYLDQCQLIIHSANKIRTCLFIQNMFWGYIGIWLWVSEWETRKYKFDLLWPGEAIWHHRPGSTLDQVMTLCLMAPSHYLN